MENIKNSPTFRLFVRPSFIDGWARIIDLGATLDMYNKNKTEQEADILALKSDWKAVGNDIKSAIDKFKYHHEEFRSTKG